MEISALRRRLRAPAPRGTAERHGVKASAVDARGASLFVRSLEGRGGIRRELAQQPVVIMLLLPRAASC